MTANALPRSLSLPTARKYVSVANGTTVLARLGAAVQHVGFGIDQDPLVTAAVGAHGTDLVAASFQLFNDRRGNASFRLHGTAVGRGAAAGRRGGAHVFETRRLAGFLDVHAEVDQIAEHFNVTLRLHVAAHDAKDKPGLAVPGNHGRNDGMEGTLVRLQAVGVTGIEGEERAAVL